MIGTNSTLFTSIINTAAVLIIATASFIYFLKQQKNKALSAEVPNKTYPR